MTMPSVPSRAPLAVVLRVALCLAVIAPFPSGCSDDGPSCGPGTVERKGACVPVASIDACGSGTFEVDGVCLAAGNDAASDDADASADAGDATDDEASDDVATDAEETDSGPEIPASWSCAATVWADGAHCDCGCGAFDPDCADASLPVLGCGGATSCVSDGSCPVCTPDCGGKSCGDDGCGGSCGACQDPALPICVAGTCTACLPSCNGSTCGDDGCGGSCGSCALGQLCASGSCIAPPPALSCVGHCGASAPGGCSCAADCDATGSCCADVGLCGCVPACGGNTCGADGCGGSCGDCPNGAACSNGTCAFAQCEPETCGGHGSCSQAGCACDPQFAGVFCESCAKGYVNFPACVTACSDDAGCDDGEPCTFDQCQTAYGCVHAPASVTCTDGDACTGGDACLGGLCKPTGPQNCDDSNPCTVDACAANVGCTHVAATPDGSKPILCDDGDACTGGDACAGDSCKPGKAVDCDDGNICSDDACIPASGCSHVGNGAFCQDGNPCTTGAACKGLSCTALASKPCDDGNACTDDTCNAKDGSCSHSPAAAGAPCDDDDLCSNADSCDGQGACKGGAKLCAKPAIKGLMAHFSATLSNSMAFGADAGLTAWQDQSGQGHALKALDGAKLALVLPTGINGRRGVSLDGGAGLATGAFAHGDTMTIAAVVCVGAAGGSGTIAGQGGWALGGAGAVPTLAIGGATLAPVGEPGSCHVFVGRVGGGAVDLSRSATRTSVANDSATLTAGNAALQVGVGGAHGVLGELLVYDHAVSDAEREALATWLRTAWGLPRPKPDVAWFDAADLATVVTATASGAPGDADPSGLPVAQWRDKSGQQHHADAGSAAKPLWYASGTSNGQPAIRFDGATVALQTAALATGAQTTVFAVCELDAPQPLATVVAHGDDVAWALRRDGSNAALVWQVAKDAASPKQPYGKGAWQLLTAVQDGTSALFYADPKAPQQATLAAAIAAGNAPLLLGNGPGGGRSLGGFIAELRIFATPLLPMDRALVESDLRVKFGL